MKQIFGFTRNLLGLEAACDCSRRLAGLNLIWFEGDRRIRLHESSRCLWNQVVFPPRKDGCKQHLHCTQRTLQHGIMWLALTLICRQWPLGFQLLRMRGGLEWLKGGVRNKCYQSNNESEEWTYPAALAINWYKLMICDRTQCSAQRWQYRCNHTPPTSPLPWWIARE